MNIYKTGTKYNNILTLNIIDEWFLHKHNVILSGNTGSGKSYFVLHNLYKYCKLYNYTILFLTSRKAIYNDMTSDVKDFNKGDIITVMTYQTIQNKLIKNKSVNDYTFVVCDEIHMVLNDAIFNLYTDILSEWILNTNSIKIFMSATGGEIWDSLLLNKIVDKKYTYHIPYDYSYATTYFYNKKNQQLNIIRNILNTSNNDKIIYFSNNIKTAVDIYNKLNIEYGSNTCCFNCSKFTDKKDAKMLTKLHKDCWIDIGNVHTFNNRILIATKALDVGITLSDKNIKHIICDLFDLDSIQQCLGRKRIIDNKDSCNFYLCNYGKQALSGMINSISKELKPLELFDKNRNQFNEKYGNDRYFKSKYIYFDNEIKDLVLNKESFIKMNNDLKILNKAKNTGFDYILKERLGITMKEYINLKDVEEKNKKDTLEIYLESIIGKELGKDSQNELINMIGLKDKWGKLQKGVNTLCQYIFDNYNMTILHKQVKRNGKRLTIWVINRIEKIK